MDFGFLQNMSKNIGKIISKKLIRKYSLAMLAMRQKLLDDAEQSATDAFKTVSNRAILKTAEATSDLIGNKISN